MKKLLLVFTLCVSFSMLAQDDDYEDYSSNLNWLTDLAEAKQESISSKKPILIYFTGSDWCAPCKMLKKDFFYTEAFEEKADQFVLLMIDMPRRTDIISKEQQEKNNNVVSKYNTSGGYPNLVALNDQLHIIGELSGYTFLRETDRHFAFIEAILENY
ncbi:MULTISPECIES: thioredoxin family protein [Olleya]|uniref:Thioredoxin-like n=1 Tax=Olleya namhaensis TaxID=1144750 RepID=A0A1I3QCR9_9FLAO|nr:MULTISPECIES: thioredoxin family protein [Olleya]PKG52300.1 thioredoxin family protein [Olleya sp. 1-3]SFJ31505.1 Thioredoxin-like [Olleya namhaensis]